MNPNAATEGPSKADWRGRRLAALLSSAAAFFVLASWLQATFWLNQCPGQIGADCEGRWTGLARTLLLETLLCLGGWALAAFLIVWGGASLRAAGGVRSDGRLARRLILFACAAAFVAPLLIARLVLDGFPNSGDEFSYLFQAQTFARFRLWETPPILGVDLIPSRTWIFENKWISQYPPGWAFVLAAGSLLGLPAWAITPALGVASVFAFAVFCRRVAGRNAAAIAAALYALTPFYVMNAASYFPHVFSSLLILCLCLCLEGGEIDRRGRLVAAGAFLGALATTRYFDVIALIPALLKWLISAKRSQWPRAISLLVAGFLPFAALLMLYQDAVLGAPFRSTYSVIDSPDTFLSLDPSLLAVSPLIAASRLAEFALWTSPLLLIACLAGFACKWRFQTLAFYDLIFPGFVIAYMAFANLGGNRYGPRYYMDAFPLALVTVASSAPSLLALAPRAMRALAPAGLAVFLLYLASVWPLAIAGFSRQVWSREEPFRLAAEAGLSDAVVIEETASGAGLIASDLVRNPPSLNAPALYARGGADVEAIRRAFPQRSIWRYSRPAPPEPGRLARVAP